MRLGFFGTRGVPGSYSGFETFYDKIIRRLSGEFDIFVFNRWNYLRYPFNHYFGARAITLPAIPQKHLDTISHTFLSLIYSVKLKLDVAMICIVGNALLLPLFKALGYKTVINVDGEDWRRKKWGKFASRYLKMSEKFASVFADIIVADALEVKKYYESVYGVPPEKIVYIPYGGIDDFDIKKAEIWGEDDYLKIFGLERGKYFLFVGRLVPENSPHTAIEAFLKAKEKGVLPADFKLVIVGDAPYSAGYISKIKEMAKPAQDSVVFTGYIFSSGYIKISVGAFAFLMCAEIGGTHPVLVEQMSLGNLVLCFDNHSNREVLGDAGLYFLTSDELAKLMGEVTKQSFKEEAQLMRKRAKERAEKKYSWDEIAEKYKELFLKLSSS